MADFNAGKTPIEHAFEANNNMLCPVCHKYGLCSLHVIIHGNGQGWDVGMKVVCISCWTHVKELDVNGRMTTVKRHGRFVYLYTGRPSHPDYTCQGANLPPGYTLDDIRRACECNPIREIFDLSELSLYRQPDRKLF